MSGEARGARDRRTGALVLLALAVLVLAAAVAFSSGAGDGRPPVERAADVAQLERALVAELQALRAEVQRLGALPPGRGSGAEPLGARAAADVAPALEALAARFDETFARLEALAGRVHDGGAPEGAGLADALAEVGGQERVEAVSELWRTLSTERALQHVGWRYADVLAAYGVPRSVTTNATGVRWIYETPDGSLVITFERGRVVDIDA